MGSLFSGPDINRYHGGASHWTQQILTGLPISQTHLPYSIRTLPNRDTLSVCVNFPQVPSALSVQQSETDSGNL